MFGSEAVEYEEDAFLGAKSRIGRNLLSELRMTSDQAGSS